MLTIAAIGGGSAGATGAAHVARATVQQVRELAVAAQSTSTTVPPPTGNPAATITSPATGATPTAGTATTLTATLSADLVTALQAGSGGLCWFAVGNDAGNVVRGTLDLQAGTCTATWTYQYSGTFSLQGWVGTPAQISYSTPAVSVTVTGAANSRCTGSATAPSTCVYHWDESYYTSTGRHDRVCAIDGGCQWQSAHTSWKQVGGKDYWVSSTGQTLADGDLADAYLCVGSAPSDWTSYTSNHSFDSLLGQPETSATPVAAGTCTN